VNKPQRSADGFAQIKNAVTRRFPSREAAQKQIAQADGSDSGSRDKGQTRFEGSREPGGSGAIGCDNMDSNPSKALLVARTVVPGAQNPAGLCSIDLPKTSQSPSCCAIRHFDEPRAGPWRCDALPEAKSTIGP